MCNGIDSFEGIALAHLDSVYRAAFAMCRDRETAEDLTQATFLKAFERFDTFKRSTNCKAWLLSILRNSWIDMLRHRSKVGQVLPIDENIVASQPTCDELEYTNSEDLLANFSDSQIIKALQSLPPEQRFALFLVDVEQLSHEEVAEIMAIPVGTVKSRTSRARALLRMKLFPHAQELGFTEGKER